MTSLLGMVVVVVVVVVAATRSTNSGDHAPEKKCREIFRAARKSTKALTTSGVRSSSPSSEEANASCSAGDSDCWWSAQLRIKLGSVTSFSTAAL